MGGAYFEVGNITPAAEFNIHVDPEAAAEVFGAGVPLVVMPLDVTHKALVTRARNEAFRKLGTPVGIAVAEMTGFLRTLRQGQVRLRGRAAARPLRHRLPHPSRALLGAADQRRDRDRLAADPRHDGGRLVGRDRPRAQRALRWRPRRRRLLRPADRAAGPPVSLLTLATSGRSRRLLPLSRPSTPRPGIAQQSEAARRAALIPLLEGSPHGAAYLIGPARAPIGYVRRQLRLVAGAPAAWTASSTRSTSGPACAAAASAPRYWSNCPRSLAGPGIGGSCIWRCPARRRPGAGLYEKLALALPPEDGMIRMTRRL